MIIEPVKALIKRGIALLGYQVDSPIVVFESDDWGSIRVPSSAALDAYKRKYPDHELDHYQSYDGLESSEDIGRLAEVLSRHNTEAGTPVFTLNFATANPCFDKIVADEPSIGFFVYETITETYSRYFGAGNTLDTLQLYPKAFHPQLHAREHLNATQWMLGVIHDERLRYAFELEMTGLNPGMYCAMDALNTNNNTVDHVDYLCDAAILFESLFGYASESFIPPCYVINDDELPVLSEVGINILQGGRFRKVSDESGQLNKRLNVLGRQNHYKQVQLIRNCQFEPSKYYHVKKNEDDCVQDAIAKIEQAFKFKQPAIICSHRVNYTSRVDASNREYSLRCLNHVLAHITHEYPSVIFMASNQLGKTILRGIERGRPTRSLSSQKDNF